MNDLGSHAPDLSLPPWAVDTLIWFAVGVLSIFIVAYGWIMRKYIVKIDEIDRERATYATAARVMEIELRMPEFVSRGELLAYMANRDEDLRRQYEQTREDQLRMHDQNLKGQENLREDIREMNKTVNELLGNR